MRKLFTFLAALLLMASVFAQLPEKMSYQAVVRNSSNQLVINQAIGMKISILQGASDGIVIYQETFNPNPQTNTNGLVTIEIGGGTPMIGTFGGIDWSAGPYFIKTETDPNGGTNYTITGTSQILSVPYAFFAKTAETITGGISETDPHFSSSPASNITTTDISNLSNISGINTGDQDLSNFVTTTALTNGLDTKVDKVTGKDLSTEDFTTTEKTKLAGIATGAEVNVQADWNQATNTADDYIKNKPTIPTAQVQTNWTATAGMGVLLNKPANIDEDKTDDVTISGNQTIAGNKTFTGTTTVAEPNNMNDAVTKAYVDLIRKQINTQNAGGTITDIDGNIYNTVKIGDQIWMAENLKTTKYNDGTDIPVYWWYNNDEAAYKNIYGGLYWFGQMEKVCPTGWHIPSRVEWTDLFEYLGTFVWEPEQQTGEGDAGGKLKETGTEHWNSPNTGATDEVGFTALPGGLCYWDIFEGIFKFSNIGEYAWFLGWNSDGQRFEVYIRYNENKCKIAWSGTEPELGGLSVRCVKD